MNTTTNSAGLMATPCRQHPEGDYLTRLLAALPDAVDQAMKTAAPNCYTPANASQLTAAMTARLLAEYGPTPAGRLIRTAPAGEGQ
ncbi:hypothetical protein [Streptomyces sp. 1222.5]|uniref:hypothetical protein n=1 Tax=Streptomyces sp. 1222.5 TaxID=1881026 RepID=UPI003D716223